MRFLGETIIPEGIYCLPHKNPYSHSSQTEAVEFFQETEMDDFTDPFLSSQTWPDTNTSARSSWAGTAVSQTTSLLAGLSEAYGDAKNPHICAIPSSHIIGNACTEELNLHSHDSTSSIFIHENIKYDIDKNMFPGEKLSLHNLHRQNSQPSLQDNVTQESSFSLLGVIESNSTAGTFGSDVNPSCSVAFPHSSLTMSASIESNGGELSAFTQSLGDAHSISSFPAMWPSSYPGVSSLMGQGRLQTFGFQGLESDNVILRKTCVENGKFAQLEDLPAASLHEHNELHNPIFPSFSGGQQNKLAGGDLQQQERNGLHNLCLPSLASQPQMSSTKTAGIQMCQQLPPSTEGNTCKHHMNHSSSTQSQSTPSTAGGCNEAVKPRVRARRGQATDPHSIAERLRREKIAERMKNLQELVPNSNKTDKASMLDEIIDYVKFLQLQVKVLSMSRLGAAGAVVPLLTDSQTEGCGNLLLSSPSVRLGADLSESQDSLAFEQEVVELMEASVTMAMQYLQSKGLCLMPIALATAISNQKGSSSSAIPPDRRKPDVIHGVICPSNQCIMDNGPTVKQEEAQKPKGNARELKPKA
ncbi:uncharacterized protein LOC103703328 isoform X1 [Phoenix dactylifera]|uniref:Uncharacterized protein LOC103703328 isoform X1 n=1 Tax=Phoenix dactylifera TaxID=42345 RepID=A0A8B7BSA0_PHODC|nr:uncharacterized protein LOC103703328 isoform X1 [Phoenix dactylifera]XP_008784366.2 uncharacterized protein LOC103703328 isoform X1 [Phoenix dactylifera]